ncbi:photosystem II stability/assembly factor-like protein [Aequorivita soesokkakensis]|uniref:Photosystem II stability/assembly factor-like protein n=1 Tax=Aequorivita soesokkakensis TaxID=1385699 RepID=A0A1A9LA16_9FLAO|nr:YCF48-related protein [Aequorivita soesokkakensis]OAD90128.1 photosystem II stability/assembly factor-like protein [Aequorivita soesokkakensis]
MKIRILLTLIAFSTISFFTAAQPTWKALDNAPSGLGRFDDIFFLNEQLGWAANGPSGLVFKTTDGGQTWEQQLELFSYFRNIEFIDENIGLLGTLDGVFYRTADGGENWQEVFMSTNPDAICGIDAVGENTVYGCGAWFTPAYFIKSTDAGVSWEYTDMSDYATALVEVLFVDEQFGYASGQNEDGGIILRTEDGGENWEEIYNSGNAGEYVWKLQLMENNTFIYGSVESGFQGKLIKSFDSGATWEEKNFPDPSVQGIGFVSPTHGWMGGHNSGFYETTDGGNTWTDIGLGFNLNRFLIFNDHFGYASGETIYKFEDELSVSDFSDERSEDISITIAPMPIKEKLNISIDFTHIDNLLIEVYDMTGKRLESLMRDRIAAAGTKHYSFDFPYAAGTYLINFQTNNGRRSHTVIKE